MDSKSKPNRTGENSRRDFLQKIGSLAVAQVSRQTLLRTNRQFGDRKRSSRQRSNPQCRWFVLVSIWSRA